MSKQRTVQQRTARPGPAAPSASEHSGPAEVMDEAGTAEAMALGHPTAQPIRRRAVDQLQHTHGNAFVQRVVGAAAQHAGALQRDPLPAIGPDPDVKPKKKFESRYLFGGPNFDAEYKPVGPVPATGELVITLRVFIDLKDFDLTMIRQEPFKSYFRKHPLTREQRNDFAWPKEEAERAKKRGEFGANFKKKVEEGWGEKHTLRLKDDEHEEYQCAVKINVEVIEQEKDAGRAHNRITVQKVPAGVEARFRSFVSGHSSTLDYRDATENERRSVRPTKLIRQIKPFPFDSAELTPDLLSQIKEVEGQLQGMQMPGKKPEEDGFFGEGFFAALMGRASARGNREYNKDLGERRALAVLKQVSADLGWPQTWGAIGSEGAENATDDEKFQRVDISVDNPRAEDQQQVEQNVAAHEAGHMFGLGDEYVDEKPPSGSVSKFQGDEPSHFNDVKALLDDAAAQETIVNDSGSMMAGGSDVKRGHYVYFVQALNGLTSARWSVE